MLHGKKYLVMEKKNKQNRTVSKKEVKTTEQFYRRERPKTMSYSTILPIRSDLINHHICKFYSI